MVPTIDRYHIVHTDGALHIDSVHHSLSKRLCRTNMKDQESVLIDRSILFDAGQLANTRIELHRMYLMNYAHPK